MEYFAVIDTETNQKNEVMSIGVVIAEKGTFKKVEESYFVLTPEYKIGGMYSLPLFMPKQSFKTVLATRNEAMSKIKISLKKYCVKDLFAYNCSFDKSHLEELSFCEWFDIMKIAAYKQRNDKIPADTECFTTGRMKRNYGVEHMMRLLSGNYRYRETHNALLDAIDELEIMRLLDKPLEAYDIKGAEQ